ncbi:MAG: hypothetical protein PHW62_00125 [Candidatus Ratteibacteria bacterium]|nr:hypothetical protein [Candidatus Ratteibacteria bacterium]
MQGGTIHPPDESGGILYPSTPHYKYNMDEEITVKIDKIHSQSPRNRKSRACLLKDMGNQLTRRLRNKLCRRITPVEKTSREEPTSIN